MARLEGLQEQTIFSLKRTQHITTNTVRHNGGGTLQPSIRPSKVSQSQISHHLCSMLVIHSRHRCPPLILFQTTCHLSQECEYWHLLSFRCRCTAESCPLEVALLCVCGVAVQFFLCRGLSPPHCTAQTMLFSFVFGVFSLGSTSFQPGC